MSASPHAEDGTPPRLIVRQLLGRKAQGFRWRPDAERRAALAADLGLLGLRALVFEGEAVATGGDVTLEGRLEAVVVQPCVVTLAPVTTALVEPVTRRYLRDWEEPEAEEAEVADDTAEALPEVIDIATVAAEALALALPLYPRAGGAELGQAAFAPPGAQPIDTEAAKPFAGLAALRDRLAGGGDGG